MFKTGDIAVLLQQGSYQDSDSSLGVKGQCVIIDTKPEPNWLYKTEEFVRLIAPREGQKDNPFPTYRERLKKL